jgi:hypothetical protein
VIEDGWVLLCVKCKQTLGIKYVKYIDLLRQSPCYCGNCAEQLPIGKNNTADGTPIELEELQKLQERQA